MAKAISFSKPVRSLSTIITLRGSTIAIIEPTLGMKLKMSVSTPQTNHSRTYKYAVSHAEARLANHATCALLRT